MFLYRLACSLTYNYTPKTHLEVFNLKSYLNSIAILVAVMAISLSACSSPNPIIAGDTLAVAEPTTPSSEGWLGLYQVAIHPDLTYDIAPVRGASVVGDFYFDLDLGIYLRGQFCPLGDCFNIVSIGTTTDVPPKITMDVSVKHPFAKYNPSLPLSGTNRADLDVFDPKVVILTEGNPANPAAGGLTDTKLTLPGSTTSLQANFGFVHDDDPINDPVLYGQPTDARLKDSAGQDVDPVTNPAEIFIFTKPAEFPTADMHPYKLIFNGTTPDGGTNNPTPNDNRMSQGEAADIAHFVFNVTPGNPTVAFIIGVSASYGHSAQGRDNRAPDKVKYLVPAYRSPTANSVKVTTTNGNISTNTPALVQISITDPQAGATVAANWLAYESQPDGGTMIPPTNRTGSVTYKDMNIELVKVSIPGLPTPLLQEFRQIDATSGNGTNSNPWVFSLQIPSTGVTAGSYPGYVLVVDDVYDNDVNDSVNESQAFVVKRFVVTFI